MADPFIGLHDIDGVTRIKFNENLDPSRIEAWTAPSSGTYFLNVRSRLLTEAGGYTLTITGEFEYTPAPTVITGPLPLAIKLIDAFASTNRPRGTFGSNTVSAMIPESRGPIVVSADPDSLIPAGIDDRMKLRVTGPAGHVQEAFPYDNDACNRLLGEQWIASEVIEFEAGVSEIEVTLDNKFDSAGSNSSSPVLYLIVLQAGTAAPEPPPWTSHC